MNIDIDDDLHYELKLEAVSERKLLKDYIEEILKNRKKRSNK